MINLISTGVKILITAILIGLFSGCVRTEVEEISWTKESAPMVFSVISPDHRMELYLGKSNFKKIASTSIPYPDAKVYLCGQDSSWTELKLQSAGHSIYVDADNLIHLEKGKTYYLRIELGNATLRAQTTLPDDAAVITEASCIAGSEASNGKKSGHLNVKLTLPQNKEYGFYLSAFSESIGYSGSLSSGTYQNYEFLYPDDISSFTLNLITIDPYYRKFLLSETVNSGQSFDSDFITIITSTFGGVLPSYSNIENGVGLFGSFITDSRQVMVTTQLK